VDGNLFTEDIVVTSAQTRDDLAELLRVVHVRADRPSLRSLEATTRHYQTPLSKTIVSEMLKGRRFPRKAVMLSFLRACGVPEEDTEPWRRAWERVASGEQQPRLASETADSGRGAPGQALSVGSAVGTGQPAELGNGFSEEAEPRNSPGPQMRRRELSAALRRLRIDAGLTIDQVAERLLCSQSKISRLETGFRTGSLRDIRDLCDLYGVTNQGQRDYLMELARQSRRQGWWQSYDIPFGTYIGLENDASKISMFEATVIPGLLQTAGYARAISQSGNLSVEVAEQHVTIRLRRQELLERENPPDLNFILDEAALHRHIGSSSVMKGQLDHLIAKSRLPHVSIRVIPFEHGAYKALDSSFSILEFPNKVAGAVYVEGFFGAIWMDRERDLWRYQDAFLDAQSVAVGEGESAEMIARIGSTMK
jgi:transcriptional regulator with XRE-family HTH domain